MNRGKGKGAAEIFWDLTPLLDVIFIVLFLVMQQSGGAARQAQEDAAALRGALEQTAAAYAEAAEEAASVRGLLDSYSLLEESAVCISLQIRRAPEEPGRREAVLTYGDGERRSVPITWDTMETAERRLRRELEELAARAQDAPVFIRFSYDSAEIYRRDYELAGAVLRALTQENAHVYIRYVDVYADETPSDS